MFEWARSDIAVTRVRKNEIEPNVLARHFAHANNMYASVARRKISQSKRMATLQSLGPIQKYGAQIDTVLTRVKKKDMEGTVLVRHLGIWYKEISGTALAGFEPVTICFRDCFKMPQELGEGRGRGFK